MQRARARLAIQRRTDRHRQHMRTSAVRSPRGSLFIEPSPPYLSGGDRTAGTRGARARRGDAGRHVDQPPGPNRLSSSVSRTTDTQTLRSIEADGLVKRTVVDVVQPHVEYELTQLGHTLSRSLVAICQWPMDHLRDTHAARAHNSRPRFPPSQAPAAGDERLAVPLVPDRSVGRKNPVTPGGFFTCLPAAERPRAALPRHLGRTSITPSGSAPARVRQPHGR
jgi:hypothetical protein